MLFDSAWIRGVVDRVMVPVVTLFLQEQNTLQAEINSLGTLLLRKLGTIEDYGAIGDGVTDDTNAFFAYVAALRAAALAGTPHPIFRLGSGRTYLVSNSIDFTNFTDMTFDFRGSIVKITGVSLSVPLIDMVGCTRCRLTNGYIYANDSTHPVLLGVMIGRVNGAAAPSVSFDNMHIEGYFTRAGVQNTASDLVTGENVTIINHNTSPTAVGIIHDALGYFSAPSDYVTGNTVSNTVNVTCNNIHFKKSRIQTFGGSALWKSGSSRNHVEDTCSFSVPSTAPLITLLLQSDTDVVPVNRAATIDGLVLNDLVTSSHSDMIYMTGSASIYYLQDLKISPMQVQSLIAAFAIDPAETTVSVQLTEVKLALANWTTLTAKVFDTPSRYEVLGEITIRYGSQEVWNAPAWFRGQLNTESHTSFNFSASSVVTCFDQTGYWVWIGLGWRDLTNKRIRLTADTTFYVTTAGNDTTGNGTLAAPWATPQVAHNWIYNNIDFNGHTVILNIGAGVFPGIYASGLCLGQVYPANYQITGAGNTTQLEGVAASNGCGFSADNGALCQLTNLTVLSSYSDMTGDYIAGGHGISAADNALVTIGGITLGACGDYQMFATNGGRIVALTSGSQIFVSGSAQALIYAQIEGMVEIPQSTITFTAAVTYSLATASSVFYGSIRVEGCVFVNPNNVTGIRYIIDYFGNITTYGGGPNFIPGTSAGTVSTSGTPAAYI